jgi:hypothetical protein
MSKFNKVNDKLTWQVTVVSLSPFIYLLVILIQASMTGAAIHPIMAI